MTFVPADRERRRARGYHPAERLAHAAARLWGLPCESLLVRGRGPRQTGLAREARRRNVAHAFAATRAERRRVLLVDDVYTTGATAHAAAAALGSHVEVATFARAVRS